VSQYTETFADRHIVLTGASSGIGYALAEALLAAGAKLTLIARREASLQHIVTAAASTPGAALAAPADVGDREAVHAAVARGRDAFGPSDGLIANAGVGDLMRAYRFDASIVEHVMRVNYLGVVYAMEAVLPAMLDRGSGWVAGVSSLASFRGLPRSLPYSASKAALSTMLESARIELRPKGIFVTTISPGFVRTPMTDQNDFTMPFIVSTDYAVTKILRGISCGRSHVAFPPPLAWALRFTRILPNWLYDRIALYLA